MPLNSFRRTLRQPMLRHNLLLQLLKCSSLPSSTNNLCSSSKCLNTAMDRCHLSSTNNNLKCSLSMTNLSSNMDNLLSSTSNNLKCSLSMTNLSSTSNLASLCLNIAMDRCLLSNSRCQLQTKSPFMIQL